MKNLKCISLGIAMLISVLTFGQEKDSTKLKVQGLQIIPNCKGCSSTISLSCGIQKNDDTKYDALIIIDCKKSTAKKFSKIKHENIESVNIIKGIDAVNLYGKKAKNGVVIIKTKNVNN